MIAITFLLRRNPELPVAEFDRYRRDEHRPPVAHHAVIEALRART